MSELIERVALATCGTLPCICKHKLGFEGMPCLARGRKALEAIREPTAGMCDAVAKAGLVLLENAPFAWLTMIDEALRVESAPYDKETER